MKSFFKKKGIIALCVCLVLALIIGISAYRSSGKAGILSDASGSFSAPLRHAVTGAAEWVEGIYGYVYKYHQLEAENEELRNQLYDAREQARLGAEAIEENKVLREALGFSEKHSDFVLESTKVIEWTSSSWSSSFTISKGSDSGIEVGDPVVTEFGAIVGQIAELGTTWATVRTVIDVDTKIGVLVGESGGAAMLIGDFSLMKRGYSKLTYLTEGIQLLQGEPILSSGKGGVFPQGLVIGYIEGVETDAGGQTIYGLISPAGELNKLAQVFVIKEFEVFE